MKLATRATTVVVAGGAVAAAAVALAIGPDQPNLTNVASANPKDGRHVRAEHPLARARRNVIGRRAR